MRTAAPGERDGGAESNSEWTGPLPNTISRRCLQAPADCPPSWRTVGTIAAAIIAHRYGLAPAFAALVAEHHLGEGAP